MDITVDGLQGKVIVFAGAGGIATATAEIIGTAGGIVVVGDVHGPSAERTAAAAVDAGGDGVGTIADISDEESVKDLVNLAISRYGRIDGLFNVASNLAPDDVIADSNAVDIDLAVWQRSIAINLTGYLLTARHAIPHMLSSGGGAIVNTISDGIYNGMADNVAYQATKAGVSALTRHIARAYGKQGIRANSISPGMVLTERNKRNVPAEQLDMILSMIASDRHGRPEDLGATVAFLLSDHSQWITGQVIGVNGGGIMRA